MLAVGAQHLPHPDVGMVGGHVIALDEAHAEQARGDGELGGDHIVERQIRLHLVLVEVVARRAGLLRIVPPVPGFQRVAGPFLGHDTPHVRGLRLGLGARAFPHLVQQVLGLLGRAGHGVGRAELREIVEAEQTRPLQAQRQNPADRLLVVEVVVVVAAVGPALKQLPAQIAAGGKRHERLEGGPRQRDDVLALHVAIRRSLCRRG